MSEQNPVPESKAYRWLPPLLLVAPFLIALGFLVVKGFPPLLLTGDAALLEQATFEAAHGRQLLGPYTRFGFNHPGPAFFYAAAPLYRLAGHRASALFVAALLINALAVIGMTVAWRRIAGPARSFLLAGLLSVFLFQMGGWLGSIWNPYVSILPFAACFIFLTAVAAGHVRWLVAAGVAGSFSAQCHFAYIPSLAALTLSSLALLFLQRARTPGGTTAGLFRTLAATTAVALAIWALPLIEEWRGAPGNMERIVRFFAAQDMPHVTADHFMALSRAITGCLHFPLLSAPGLSPDHWLWITHSLAVLQMLLFGAAGVVCLRRSAPSHERVFFILTVVFALCAGYSILRIVGPLHSNLYFWMTCLSVFMWYVIASVVSSLISARAQCAPRVATFAMRAVWCLLVAWAVWGSVRLCRSLQESPAWDQTAGYEQEVRRLLRETMEFLGTVPRREMLVREMNTLTWATRTALILELRKNGIPLRVDPYLFNQYPDDLLATAPTPYYLFLGPPRLADRMLPGTGLREVSRTAHGVVLFRDVAESIERNGKLAYTHLFTAWSNWGLERTTQAGVPFAFRTTGIESGLVVELRPATGYEITLEIRPTHGRRRPRMFFCSVNGASIGSVELPDDKERFMTVRWPVPSEIVREVNSIGFHLRGGGAPLRRGQGPNGVEFKSVTFTPENGVP